MGDLTVGEYNWADKGTGLFEDVPWKPRTETGYDLALFMVAKTSPGAPTVYIEGETGALDCFSAHGIGATLEGRHGLVATGHGGIGAALVGRTHGVIATGNKDHGLLGTTKGRKKAGVFGFDGTGTGYGVAGKTRNKDGAAVVGENIEAGTGVLGVSFVGYGVQGYTSGAGKAGVWGSHWRSQSLGFGVLGTSISKDGAGVLGVSEPRGSAGVSGTSSDGVGVWGYGKAGTGVMGMSHTFHAVVGSASDPTRCGVVGINAAGVGVGGKSMTGIGVVGESSSGDGVFGISKAPGFFAGVAGVSTHGVGVAGVSGRGIGVSAQTLESDTSVGLYAKAPHVAAIFEGDVLVNGNFVVASGYNLTVDTPGNKNGVVAFADGSHRLVCAIESPEAWFEDFGEASLVKGKAHVGLDPHFAQTIDTSRYHVFLTPYGETAGLHVSRRTKGGFDIAERKPGKSNVRFSWRVAARPKATNHKRFAKTTTPQALDRVHSAIARDNRRRRIDVTVLKTDDVDMRVRSVPKLPTRTKPKLPPPRLPDLPKRRALNPDIRRLMKKARKPIGG